MMKNLFEASAAGEIRERVAGLGAESERVWGKMSVAQMLAHCSAWMEFALGERVARQSLMGRVFGRMAKGSILGEKPISRGMPTDKRLVVVGERDFEVEQERLIGLVERFSKGGAAGCTVHPHSFFGRLTPEEWARMGYRHLDHHLRQFGA
jgi:hypothetical protein